MIAIVTRGDAANLHLPDSSVDLVVTSPPYFGLRSYTDGGEHYEGQVGDEATPAEYLDALIACTAEWMRVLKPGGSIFVNLGDKYAGGGGYSPGSPSNVGNNRHGDGKGGARSTSSGGKSWGFRPKTLTGLPWRYAIRCIDELGLILRAEIVWAKPNGLPESVTDRVRRSHEQVFHFVKQPRYYSAVDEIREPHLFPGQSRTAGRGYSDGSNGQSAHSSLVTGNENPLGKLPGSVWTIATSPLRVPAELGVDHFAAYPPELVRRIILGWSPREVCTACGEGRRPVVDKVSRPLQATYNGTLTRVPGDGRQDYRAGVPSVTEATITGYACACPDTTAPATPGVVLDPFGGTGTTALVASAHGRVGISVDLSADYCRLAQWRVNDPKQRAKAAGVKSKPAKKPKPTPEPAAQVIQLPIGQIDLFGEGEPA